MDDNALVIEWDRVNPNIDLIRFINEARVGLLFPDTTQQHTLSNSAVHSVTSSVRTSDKETNDVSDFDALIIIDSTWQEARKIYNRSPYLKELKKVSIDSSVGSIYELRRNQLEGGLCTAECAAHILKQCGNLQSAEKIMDLLRLQISVTN
ncbi:hypothetical protein TUM4249_15090 [Shewanella sp. KT0246]|nr:hypothetical protein TUM4249_15090 [Shewanella sp. KT0246]